MGARVAAFVVTAMYIFLVLNCVFPSSCLKGKIPTLLLTVLQQKRTTGSNALRGNNFFDRVYKLCVLKTRIF